MSPLAVLKTLWSHKIITLPVAIVTLLACVYVLQFAPRSYDSTMTYALINPSIPTPEQILKDPRLAQLNSNNPYLRSSDPSLISQVVITRLNDPATAEKLVAQGLSPKYTVTRSISGQSSFLIDIVGSGSTPAESVATSTALGKDLEESLYALQKVNGASDEYTYTSLIVVSPDQAIEQFSSRLRSIVVVFLGGAVLMFGAVSAARALDRRKEEKLALTDKSPSETGSGRDFVSDSGLSTTQSEDLLTSPDTNDPQFEEEFKNPRVQVTSPSSRGTRLTE